MLGGDLNGQVGEVTLGYENAAQGVLVKVLGQGMLKEKGY